MLFYHIHNFCSDKFVFSVPKVKSEDENSGLQPKMHVDNVKDSNIELSKPNEKV